MASFAEWVEQEKKKKKKEELTKQERIAGGEQHPAAGLSFSDYAKQVLGRDDFDDPADIAPVKKTTESDDKEKWYEGWFQKGATEDGATIGNIAKSGYASTVDINENVATGVIGSGEKLVDAGLMLGAAGAEQQMKNTALEAALFDRWFGGIADWFKGFSSDYASVKKEPEKEKTKEEKFNETLHTYDDVISDMKAGTEEAVAKDLYDEKKIAQAIISGLPEKITGINVEEDSFLANKTDSLAQSAGQMGVTVGLNALAPGMGTAFMFGTAFGAESENALREGATYDEALVSSYVSALGEVLTEQLSGGIRLPGVGTLDDLLTKQISQKITNKYVSAVLQFGLDAFGEGAEEWIAEDIGAFGRWMTYQSEEELKNLLWSEDALNAKIEAFIGGAALGGSSNVVKGTKSVISSKLNSNKLNENEQKVADAVTEARIAEEEKGGKKLTNKQKADIEAQVREDLEKGRIDTDTIESVLGMRDGDNYKSYTDTLASEEAIVNEYNELADIPENELSRNQRKRLDELEGQIEDAKAKTGSKQFKQQYDEEVSGIVKNSRFLTESYNEKARRGQAFEVDLSQYEGKEKEILQGFMDKGQINNTNQAKDFWLYAAKVGAEKGLNITSTTTEEIIEMETKKHGKEYVERVFADGVVPNAYIMEDGTLAINVKSVEARRTILGHEITHTMEKGAQYKAMQDLLFSYAEAKMGTEAFNQRKAELEELYKDVKGANAKNELTADLVGEYLYGDPDFVRHLSTQNQNLFQKIWSEIKYLYKMATAGSQEARELEKIKRMFEQEYRNSGKVSGDSKFSLSMVEAIQPTSDKWMKGASTEEVREAHPTLYAVDEEATEKRNPTQVKGTIGSYRNIYDSLQAEGFNGTILDASSGLGYGTKAGVEEYGFNVDDIEPYPDKGYKPKYTDYSTLDKTYDVVISNAVLNVLPQDQRDALVVKMGELLNPGGRMFVNVRGKDVLNASGKIAINEANMEYFIPRTEKTGSYQKGFTKPELVAYLEDALGEGYTVKPTNMLNGVAAIVTKDGGAKYSLSSMGTTFFGNESAPADAFVEGSYKQTPGYQAYVNECLNNYKQTRGDSFDEAVARKEIEDGIDGIVRVALAAKRAGYDIFDDGIKRNKRDSKNRLLFSSLEPNSDYFTSSDISTICDKRQNFADIYDEIVRAEEAKGVPQGKRFFDNINNYFYLHGILAEKGLTQPCRECYVESMRKNLAPMANAFLRLVNETDANNTANDQLYQQKGKNKGALKTNNAALRERVLDILAENGMSASDLTVETLTTEDGLAQLRIQAPLVYEAFNSFYGQSKPKMPKSATPFRFGELTALLTDEHGKIKQSLVDKINATGGFRLQSYSDFQIQNYTDVLQTIFEAGTLGLSGHAYTKVPAFLEATEGTNLKRNISIFMYKDGNEWKLDRNDSFPYTLEEIYDIVKADKTGNTSIIAVSQNEDMSAWIMANDNIGYFIPFHKSGLKMATVRDTIVREDGREIKGYTGTKDHTRQQAEVWATTTADHKALTNVKKGINIYEFWDFANEDNLSKNELIEKNVKRYIDECEKAGYLPKFREYVMNNGKVLNSTLAYAKELGFVSQDATIEDISFEYKGYTIPYGYYKCLGDFGMFTPDGKASSHDVLSLNNYDFDKAEQFFADAETLRRNEILQQFANDGERQRYADSDLTAGELADIIKQKRAGVVEDVMSRYGAPTQYSLSKQTDSTYMDAVNRGDTDAVQKMVDDAAKSAGYTQKKFHETKAENIIHIFNLGLNTNASADYETPFGVFTKSHNRSVGLGGKQMELYVKAENTFKLKDRTEIAPRLPAEYSELVATIKAIDEEYLNKTEGLDDDFLFAFSDWLDENDPDDRMREAWDVTKTIEEQFGDVVPQEILDLERKYTSTMDEWRGKTDKAILEAKEWLTKWLRDNGYDSMELEFDNGAGGRVTDALIVLDPNQVKSADPITYDDSGNVIPLSQRFNAEQNDIRYSLSRQGDTHRYGRGDGAMSETALVRDDVAPVQDSVQDSVQDVAPVVEAPTMADTLTVEDVMPIAEAPVTEQYEAIKPKPEAQPRMGEIAQVVSPQQSVGAAPYGFDPVSELQYEYGTIPEGEHPVRDDSLPKTTNGNDRVSYSARTVKGAEATPDGLVDLLDKEVVAGRLSYIPIKNSDTVKKAYAEITKKGWEAARGEWEAKVRKGEASAEMTATGALLLNNAAKAGDKATWLNVLHTYQLMNTNIAQALQASRILKTLSPDDSLYMIERSVEQMVEDMKLDTDIVIDEKLKRAYIDAKTDKAKDAALKNLAQDVAKQIPSTAMDKWTALRYLNMLGNFRTQSRNIFGNVGMSVTSRVKNAVAASIEAIAEKASGGKFHRTKSLFVSKDLLKASTNDFANVEHIALNGGKFDDSMASSTKFQQEVKDSKTVFKFAPLEKYRRATNWAMNSGDLLFSKPAYGRALAGYLKANGITETDFSKIDQQTLDEARAYAIKEAQETTFRDNNWLSDWVSKVGRRKDTPKVGKLVSEGILPFRKTPANILVRAEEYSPLGIINATVDSIRLAKGSENVTGADVVNSWAKALTGTGLFALGMLLNNSGALSGGPDEDDDKEWFENQYGWQNYSIQIGDYNFTIDFFSPSAMPLLMGSQFNELRQKGGVELKDLESSLLSIADPMIEMSMLQGVNDTLDNVRYAESNMGQFLINSCLSYFTQGLTNTFLGQLERSFEGQRMSTYVDKDSAIPAWLQKALGSASAKTPVWDFQQIPYVDAWGETEDIAPLPALAENTLSPSYINKGISDDVYNELNRLNEAQSDINVYPQTPDKTVTFDDAYGNRHENYNLSADEYVELAKLQGETQKELVKEILSSNSYNGLTDQEKAKAVQLAYQYAKEYGRQEVLGADGFSAKWMGEADNIVDAIIAHTSEERTFAYDYPEKYAFFKDNGISYESYKNADEDGKRAYSWAYENPGKYTMSKTISDDFLTYYQYKSDLFDIKADKDANGDTITGSGKDKKIEYINSLDLDYGQKIILFRSLYDSKTDKANYNADIVEYLNSRDDISYEEMVTILEELDFTVYDDGTVTW